MNFTRTLGYEWMDGLGGFKAARLFTAQESGRVKHTFSKRKVFRDKVDEMVIRANWLAEAGINKRYRVYGEGQPVHYATGWPRR
jgi:hypothetical protein